MIPDNVQRKSVGLFYTFLKIRLDDCCSDCASSFFTIKEANFPCGPQRTQIATHAQYILYIYTHTHTHVKQRKKITGRNKSDKSPPCVHV